MSRNFSYQPNELIGLCNHRCYQNQCQDLRKRLLKAITEI